MKHLTKFQQDIEYQSFKEGEDFVTPNVSYVVDIDKCYFEAKKLIENMARKTTKYENFVQVTRFVFDYPIDSDITVVYRANPSANQYGAEATKVLTKGTTEFNIGVSVIVSFTPSQDSKYIYTSDTMYNPS